MERPGDVVLSLRGRDEGRALFVVGVSPDGRLLVADGRVRRIESPKKKQTKHVKLLSSPECRVADKLRSGEKVTNGELRRALAETENRGFSYG